MRIRRDYSQPFFREPKRHRTRNTLIAVILGLLLGLSVVSQRTTVELVIESLVGDPATPTPLPSELAMRAGLQAQAGVFPTAAALMATAVSERPHNIAYLYEYGKVLIELGRYDEALTYAERIIDLDASDAHGFALKSAALVAQGKPAVAIPVAVAGLDMNPGFTPLYGTLSRAYIDTQRWPDGLEAGERGLSINPGDAELVRAYAYALQSVGAYDEAAEHLERAIELRPSYLPVHFELAALYLARDNDQQAIDLYDRILAIDSRNARAMLRLCLAYRKVGQFARALGFCEDSVANDSSDAEALFHLGLLYYRERRFVDSRATFQQCLDHDDGAYDLSCRYRLGLSHYYTGECTTGWALLQESLALAEAATGYSDTIDRIQQGLEAINSDLKCIETAAAPVSFQD